MDEADQPDVEPHVAVEDVAELVGDDALQLVAGELAQAAAGDGHHGVGRGEARGEGVDAVLVEDVDRRDRDSRGDGHLLDDVEQTLLVAVGGVGRHEPPAEQLGDRGAPALAQLAGSCRGCPGRSASATAADTIASSCGSKPAGRPLNNSRNPTTM